MGIVGQVFCQPPLTMLRYRLEQQSWMNVVLWSIATTMKAIVDDGSIDLSDPLWHLFIYISLFLRPHLLLFLLFHMTFLQNPSPTISLPKKQVSPHPFLSPPFSTFICTHCLHHVAQPYSLQFLEGWQDKRYSLSEIFVSLINCSC